MKLESGTASCSVSGPYSKLWLFLSLLIKLLSDLLCKVHFVLEVCCANADMIKALHGGAFFEGLDGLNVNVERRIISVST